MSIGTIIRDQISKVANEQGKHIEVLSDDLVLLESGLDSLCFAIVVVRLEELTGRDPFSEQDELVYPVTLSDFIQLYEKQIG
jgi:acyl carrier protein